MTTPITTNEEAKRLIDEKRYSYFTLPSLSITVKYRKPDILKLALNKSLPSVIAETILAMYKAQLAGEDGAKAQDQLAKIDPTDELLGELRDKGYVLLQELVVNFKIMKVEQSDLDNSLIAFNDIPEEDALAFLMNLIMGAQVAKTVSGGETSVEEVIDFPVRQRMPKRTASSKNG